VRKKTVVLGREYVFEKEKTVRDRQVQFRENACVGEERLETKTPADIAKTKRSVTKKVKFREDVRRRSAKEAL